MHCNRCYYDIGVTTTRCRVCGANVPRIRATFIAMLSLIVGVGLGSAAMFAL
jgi:hypothetical protein